MMRLVNSLRYFIHKNFVLRVTPVHSDFGCEFQVNVQVREHLNEWKCRSFMCVCVSVYV